MVGVDGSDRAHRCLGLVEYLRREEDEVVIVHVDEGASEGDTTSTRMRSADVTARYAALVEGKPGLSYKTLSRAGYTSTADVMVAFLEEVEADVVAVGVDGMGAYAAGKTTSVGSTSDQVVRKSPCTVLCYQDTRGTYGGGGSGHSAAGGGAGTAAGGASGGGGGAAAGAGGAKA